MGIDHHVGSVLPVQVIEQVDQYHVFEDVGMIAGVEGMTVAKHEEACGETQAAGLKPQL
jgi:hypothetical protein